MVNQKQKIIIVTGKRKSAIARATVKPGQGRIIINSKPLKYWGTEVLRQWILEPLMLAGEKAKKLDFRINVKSGGIAGQAEAVRQAIAKGIVEFFKDEKLKKLFLEFDRNLLIYDPRRNEPHKPSRSRKGARRHKQRSKR